MTLACWLKNREKMRHGRCLSQAERRGFVMPELVIRLAAPLQQKVHLDQLLNLALRFSPLSCELRTRVTEVWE